MERLSIFDIYKIGVGPSSSHTLGPWRAAMQFAEELKGREIDSIEIHLYGSLSKTGKGHATDLAVQLGLEGFDPKTIATEKIDSYIQRIRSEQTIRINQQAIGFQPQRDIYFRKYFVPDHPNTLTFKAFLQGQLQHETRYCSVGGGFIQKAGESDEDLRNVNLPYPIDKGSDLLAYIEETGLPISEIVYQNELCFNEEEEIEKGISAIFNTMLECVYRGCHTGGILPGGLKVRRRAQIMNEKLLEGAVYEDPRAWLKAIRNHPRDFNVVNNWVSCFALAVNEENAALGRVVTSPTNGAAGVIPCGAIILLLFLRIQGQRRFTQVLLYVG
jgi:L-serine dehydratase